MVDEELGRLVFNHIQSEALQRALHILYRLSEELDGIRCIIPVADDNVDAAAGTDCDINKRHRCHHSRERICHFEDTIWVRYRGGKKQGQDGRETSIEAVKDLTRLWVGASASSCMIHLTAQPWGLSQCHETVSLWMRRSSAKSSGSRTEVGY